MMARSVAFEIDNLDVIQLCCRETLPTDMS